MTCAARAAAQHSTRPALLSSTMIVDISDTPVRRALILATHVEIYIHPLGAKRCSCALRKPTSI